MELEAVGPYTVERELGRGAMGVVLLARDPLAARRVAIKLLHVTGEQAVKRFAREVEALGRLHHAGIVTIHTAGEHQGRPYLVMDFVAGESLADRLQRTGPLPPRDAAELTRKLALALDHAHTASILHRDIKPANILMSPAGEPLLTDFGLACDTTAPRSSLTKSGMFMGTPGYWAPEQARGDHARLGPTTDVYSLGATLYATLTGAPPVSGETLLQILVATEEHEPPRPSTLAPAVPADLDWITLRCLEKSPEARYDSAAELATDLGRFLAGERVGAPSRSLNRKARKRIGRLLAGLTVAATLLASGAGWLRSNRRAETAAIESFDTWTKEVLVPYSLGLGPGPAPTPEELADRRASLERLGTSTPASLKPAQRDALATLDALERLAAAAPRSKPSRVPLSNLVSALLLSDAGDHTKALGYLRRGSTGPGADEVVGRVWARVWERALTRGDWRHAHECLEDFAQLSPAIRQSTAANTLGRSVASAWLAGQYNASLSKSPAGFQAKFDAFKRNLSLCFPKTEVGAVLTAARRAALDGSVEIERQLKRLAPQRPSRSRPGVWATLGCVGVLARGDPPLKCAPLERAIANAMQPARAVTDESGSISSGDWALTLESAAFYTCDRREPTPDEYRAYVDIRSSSGEVPEGLVADLLPAVFRLGLVSRDRDILPKALALRYRGAASALLETYPASRTARYVNFGYAFQAAGNHTDSDPDRTRLLALGRTALADGLVDDLHPEYLAILHVELGNLGSAQPKTKVRTQKRAGIRLRDLKRAGADYRAAISTSDDGNVLDRAYRGLAGVLVQLDRLDEALALRTEAVALLRARVTNATPDRLPIERQSLAKSLVRLAGQRYPPNLPPSASEPLLREAEALFADLGKRTVARMDGLTDLATLLRLRGDPEAADAALLPMLDQIDRSEEFAWEAIRVSIARGQLDEAKARYVASRRRARSADWIKRVTAELAAAGVELD